MLVLTGINWSPPLSVRAVGKAATCQVRVTVGTPRLWPKPCRSTPTPWGPCTLPEHTNSSTSYHSSLYPTKSGCGIRRFLTHSSPSLLSPLPTSCSRRTFKCTTQAPQSIGGDLQHSTLSPKLHEEDEDDEDISVWIYLAGPICPCKFLSLSVGSFFFLLSFKEEQWY